MVLLHFWFTRVFQKRGGEKPWNASVICETDKANLQTESHRVKVDLEFKIPSGPETVFLINLHKRQKLASSMWYTDATRNIHPIRAEFLEAVGLET